VRYKRESVFLKWIPCKHDHIYYFDRFYLP
jgi:hypothetical protein